LTVVENAARIVSDGAVILDENSVGIIDADCKAQKGSHSEDKGANDIGSVAHIEAVHVARTKWSGHLLQEKKKKENKFSTTDHSTGPKNEEKQAKRRRNTATAANHSRNSHWHEHKIVRSWRLFFFSTRG